MCAGRVRQRREGLLPPTPSTAWATVDHLGDGDGAPTSFRRRAVGASLCATASRGWDGWGYAVTCVVSGAGGSGCARRVAEAALTATACSAFRGYRVFASYYVVGSRGWGGAVRVASPGGQHRAAEDDGYILGESKRASPSVEQAPPLLQGQSQHGSNALSTMQTHPTIAETSVGDEHM
ncbi:hypothetical protein BD626DRAFT_48592 [Schizophyllum amplum]|uniref:Uncharacterized protein n=1 Tax=Schizophyllum amplum TaxID=97359 RepID=A0A550BSP9_9AGAR|nr:hypothetical protein BD626DRAFT_48592 [Auriculariopsis ampla]